MSEIFSLSNKTALITGSTGYLGQTLAIGLAEFGAKVYLNGRSESKVNKLLKKINLDVEPAIFDITNSDEVDSFFKSIDNKPIDVLVNNAMSGNSGSIETSTTKDYSLSYDIAVITAHNIVQNALPNLRLAVEKNGYASVVNIASMYGMVSPDLNIYNDKYSANPPFYGAAKAALIQWTKYAACEFARENIRFNSISPGPFPSEYVQKNNKSLVKNIEKKVPMNRIGHPEELVGALIFLASNSSSYVTGTNVIVDGGWTSW
jgi:NAD(P)-dependent dehydrogenase (short-subunit alcohol dehydrogenase family)